MQNVLHESNNVRTGIRTRNFGHSYLIIKQTIVKFLTGFYSSCHI